MNQKAKMTLIIAGIITLSSFGTAIEINDIQLTPLQPRFNDSVGVEIEVDAQDDYIQRVNMRVLENSTEIYDSDLSLVSGQRYGIAYYEDPVAFETANETATYYITGTAVASNGETDTESLVVKIKPASTVIIEDEVNTDAEGTTLFGQNPALLLVSGLILIWGYFIFRD